MHEEFLIFLYMVKKAIYTAIFVFLEIVSFEKHAIRKTFHH